MSLTKTVRATEPEWERWALAASRAGLSLNAWARRSMTRVAELEEMLARVDAPSKKPPTD